NAAGFSIIKPAFSANVPDAAVILLLFLEILRVCSILLKGEDFVSTARFDISHAPAPRESFRLLYISKSRFGGDWNSTAHTHACTELLYCLSGAGQFFIQGQLYPVPPDDRVIVNPQVEHTELSLNAAPLEYVVLGISGIEVLFGNSDEPYAILNCREQRERLFSLLHMLLAEADHSLDGYETVCQDLLEVLLIW